jgi:hypothetical protein
MQLGQTIPAASTCSICRYLHRFRFVLFLDRSGLLIIPMIYEVLDVCKSDVNHEEQYTVLIYPEAIPLS